MQEAIERVVVVVFDGLRPDMIAGRMPRLEAFAGESVWFTEATSVFPSVTRVATTSVATGCWPRRHGIVNNAFHQPGILTGKALDTSDIDNLLMADQATGGRIIEVPSLGERLAAAGKRMGAVHCGSAGSAFLLNHRVRENGHWTLSAAGEPGTRTPEIMSKAAETVGPLPNTDIPKFEAVDYAARAARTIALAEDGPEVVVVWFPEPDTSFHYREIGTDPTRAVMAAADAAFAEVLETARAGARGARTAVLAISDHGQISTSGRFEIGSAMRADGLPASTEPGEGDRIALTVGASGECRGLGDDPALTADVARWLMGREEIGMVFARDDLARQIDGTLPLSAARLDHARAPDLFYVCRSSDGPDPFGLRGLGLATGGAPVGGGMHGGLHRCELNTVLMLSVPEGAAGIVDGRPCGLVDIAPTVLSLLGLPHDGMDGAPLTDEAGAAETTVTEAAANGFAQSVETRGWPGRTYLSSGGRH